MSETTARQMSARELFRRFLPYFGRYKAALIFDLFCASLTTVCEIVFPLIVREITNRAMVAPDTLTIPWVLKLGLLYLVLRVVDTLGAYYMQSRGHFMGARIETDMRRDLFRHLEERGTGFDREYVIPRCIERKRALVAEDEFDRGQRQLLNLGHTLGHAAEMLSRYRLSHGRAVAMGLAEVSRAALADGSCSRECASRILAVLRRFGLPDRSEYPGEDLYQAMLSDKKRRGERISLIVPEEIGRCVIRSCTLEEMREFFRRGREPGGFV